jgi:hypothetical protein
MSEPSCYEITLKLDNIKDLFQKPEFDPFIDRDNFTSGIDRIVSTLKPKSLNGKVRTTILLPADRISDDIEQLTSQALQRYCSAKIDRITNDLASLRGQGIRALQRGLIFLAVCLLLSSLFDGLVALPGLLRQFLSEGFLIAGWVSLWHPIELLLYDWGPYWRKKKIYERIEAMELKVTSQK